MQRSYSHAGQDIYIHDLIADWGKKPEETTVMEVGARDGLNESNSRLFAKKVSHAFLAKPIKYLAIA